jgi:hypothetical protein
MRLLRNAPGAELQAWLQQFPIDYPEQVDWSASNGALSKPLRRAIDDAEEVMRERIRRDAERIDRMTSEVGQTALMTVARMEQRAALKEIATKQGRALRLLWSDQERFRSAEEISFFENARKSKTWDAFVAPLMLKVSKTPAASDALKAEVRKLFQEGPKIKIEIFERSRTRLEGTLDELIHVAVFRETLPDSVPVFQGDDEVEPLVFRPVVELGFTYEPSRGLIEVVAPKKQQRTELAQIFARTLLGHEIKGERLPPRFYNLALFMQEQEFDFDPEDGIESVRLAFVKFESLDGRTLFAIEPKDADDTIHAAARREFAERSPFRPGNRIVEVVIAVRFRPARGRRTGPTVDIKLTHPNGCNLKDKSERERLLAEKYLKRWGVIEDLS